MSDKNQGISITRALTELKTIDKRIQKAIDGSEFVSLQGQFHQPSQYAKSAEASYQSIMDMLERRKKIKSMIVISNAMTRVYICGKEMSVAEAIETKSSIKHYKNLLMRLKQQYGDINRRIEDINEHARRELENKSNRSGGGNSSNSDREENKMDLVEFSKRFMDMHGVRLYDPLKIANKIEELEKYITNFEAEVDYVLSEKNSTTFIPLDE